MQIDKFGCMLEESFGHRDERFNCALKDYENNGDPCKNSKEYYEGIEFPEGQVKNVHPWLDGIQLEWEHGKLQSVSFTLNRKVSPEQITQIFSLPEKESLPVNIIDTSVQDCSRAGTCLLLIGFDHMGAGDVAC
jgi:hypothetical protein